MIYPICRRGENLGLEKRAARVRKFDASLKELVDDMFATMYAAHGVGLAAPQIGVQLQVAVIDITFGADSGAMIVLVNPKIHKLNGEQWAEEGCLSIPGMRTLKRRFESVTVRARTEKGKSFTLTGAGLLARAIQHEWDHLQGIMLDITESSARKEPK